MKTKQLRCTRTATGSGIVEGTVALWLIILGVVGGTLLLINTGIAMYYKQKLSFITHEAAHAAVDQMVWNNGYRPFVTEQDVVKSTKNRLIDIAKKMGLPQPSKIDVTVSATDITVTATLTGMQLMGNGALLPGSISLSDTAVALVNTSQPPGTAVIRFGSNYSQAILVPCYGKYDPKISCSGPTSANRTNEEVLKAGYRDGYAHLLNFPQPYYGSYVTLAEGNGQGSSFEIHN
jgi:hypothetical protein